MAELRKYGTATTILFPLIEFQGTEFETAATFAAGDTKISKDEGAFANTGSNPAHEGNGIYSLALTATEMQAARIVAVVIDQTATKVWEDQAVLIETYGSASGQHGFNLGSVKPDVNLATWLGIVPDALSGGSVKVTVEKWLGSVPNGLQSGRVDSYVGAMASGVLTVAATAAAWFQEAADRILDRPISNVEPGAVFRTLYGAVASLVNRRRISGGSVEVYKTDDATVLASLAATTDASQEPVTELDPP